MQEFRCRICPLQVKPISKVLKLPLDLENTSLVVIIQQSLYLYIFY